MTERVLELMQSLWEILYQRGSWFWYPSYEEGMLEVKEETIFEGGLVFSFQPPGGGFPRGAISLGKRVGEVVEPLLLPHKEWWDPEGLGEEPLGEVITFLEKLLSDLAFVFRGILSSPYREEVLRKRGRAPRAILPGRGLPSLEEAQKLGEAWEEWYEEAYLFLARGYLDLAEKVRDSLGRRENVAFFRSGTDGFVGGGW